MGRPGQLHHVEINVTSLEVSLAFWDPFLTQLCATTN